MSKSIWHRQRSPKGGHADFAIIGAGISGCSTAYWLKKLEPAAKVVIIESGSVAAGATGRNAGFLLLGTSNDYAADVERLGRKRARLVWEFTRENRRLLGAELDPDAIGLQPGGSVNAAADDGEFGRLQSSCRLLVDDGFDARLLDASGINDHLGSAGFVGGIHVGDGAGVNPVALSETILEMSGADLRSHDQVLDLDPAGAPIEIRTSRGQCTAGTVIVCANAFTSRLLGSAVPVRPVRAQMLAAPGRRGGGPNFPTYSHDGYFYVRRLGDGTIVAGGGRRGNEEEEEGFEDKTTSKVQGEITSYLQTFFPNATAGPPVVRWSGTMGFSPDGLPIVGRIGESTYWVGGYTGHGMGFGFAMGRHLARVCTGDPDPQVLDLFREDRS